MKKKKLWKRFTVLLLSATLLLSSSLFGSSGMQNVQAKETQECYVLDRTNKEQQDYTVWADTINSYLSYQGNQIMRVESPEVNDDEHGILVEYYDLNYKYISQKEITKELPIFGGFHETKDNYYILSGQENPNKDNDVEVFRITKYDKNWKRITSVGLYGANTTIPFRASSARMTDDGEYLLVRTSHEMYNGHQANVMIQLHMDTMEITQSLTDVLANWGYVSHSFNQFIAIDNGKVVALDHSDAYPGRAFLVTKYFSEVSSGKFRDNRETPCVYTDVISFKGNAGENQTGASVGAFEVTDSNYLLAGNYVGTEREITDSVRNIFVASVSKDLSEKKINWITNYTDGTVSTPHMVSIGNSEYMLLWTREDIVYYTKIDKNGNQIGDIYHISGALSDCVPIVVSGKLVWYVASKEIVSVPNENSEKTAMYMTDNRITFYQINCLDFNDAKTFTEVNGHSYKYTGNNNGSANFTCTKCNRMIQEKTGNRLSISWNNNWANTYNSLNVNEQLRFDYTVYEDHSMKDVNQEYIIEVSNSDIIEIKEDAYGRGGYIKAKKEGMANITFIPKYNESLAKTYTICVGNTQCVTEVDLNVWSSIYLKPTETKQLNVTVAPENATDKTIIYTSSDPSVAEVSNTGLITAKKTGRITITATAKYGNGNHIDVCNVEVSTTGTPPSIELEQSSATVKQGETITLQATVITDFEEDKTLEWFSDNPEIADVVHTEELTAEIIGKSTGTTTIWVFSTNEDVFWSICQITVLDNDTNTDTPNNNPFIDVSEDQYYYKPVLWALHEEITTGLKENQFAPENACTRGQVVTFLWRAMGEPEPTTMNHSFVDLDSNAYYYKAVLWAVEKGITTGYDKTHFAPEATVTRGQFVTFLHRAEQKPSYTVQNPFKDIQSDIYYYDAVLWALENGVTTGLQSDKFGPEEPCTRGQVVTFLYRALDGE